MGSGPLSQASDGSIIPGSDHNQIVNALLQDLVARNAMGSAADIAGSLGTSSLRFLKAFIASGYLDCGDIKIHHSYNGAAPVGEGWMKCDGRLINQSNYDTEHGSGHWSVYVGSSPLDGKYLPDFTNKYGVGKSATTQDGSAPITSVGNASHQVNLQHSHTVNGHTHDLSNHTHTLTGAIGVNTTGGTVSATTGGPSNNNSGSASPGTDTQGSATQSVQPESIEVQVYMRII